MNNIKSPLNYTGNKFRLLQQLDQYIPKKMNVFVDLFCGGATVGLNVNCRKVYFIDNNEKVINLLKFLSNQDFNNLLVQLEKIIDDFNLSYSYKYGYSKYRKLCKNIQDNNGLKDYNKIGFYRMRNKYNLLENKNSTEANLLLYMLMVYGFNNDIRFNSKGDFNLPVGKTDLNKNNVNKIKKFIERTSEIEAKFICLDFNDENLLDIIKEADYIYMDPPYLITDAVYNDCWNEDKEKKLLSFIDDLIVNNKNFGLSNVIKSKFKENKILLDWVNNNTENVKINYLKYSYRSSSYNKKNRDAEEQEVFIIRRENNEN